MNSVNMGVSIFKIQTNEMAAHIQYVTKSSNLDFYFWGPLVWLIKKNKIGNQRPNSNILFY